MPSAMRFSVRGGNRIGVFFVSTVEVQVILPIPAVGGCIPPEAVRVSDVPPPNDELMLSERRKS